MVRKSATLLLFLLPPVLTGCRQPPGDPSFVIRADEQAISSAERIHAGADTLAAIAPIDSTDLADGAAVDTTAADTTEAVRRTFPALEGARVLSVEIRGSLYGCLEASCPGELPDVLGAHLVRCMWWDVDPWRGLCAGDSLHAVYRDSGLGLENRTVALRFAPAPGSSSRPFSVYQWRRSGDNYPSYWHADGTEAMRMLNAMPVTTFEEVTGIFGEPRGDHAHAGIDYKAPEGTPVRSPRGGVVVRLDWNTGYNGRCVEIDMGGGYSEMFLHLQGIAPEVVPGARVSPGGLVGWVGNTGRSYSAHLHYQINDENGNPMDPLLFSGSHRRSLTDADLEGFGAFRAACDSLMAGR